MHANDEVRGIKWKEWLEMTSRASASLLGFAENSVNPAIHTKENMSHFQVAMTNMYGRMYL